MASGNDTRTARPPLEPRDGDARPSPSAGALAGALGSGDSPSPSAPSTGSDASRGAATLFAGPGEMRALCRDLDWAATPLGPVERWSYSLRTTATTVLASRHPMFLFWGPELVQLYNDAYRPSFGGGGRHPLALGMRAREFWTEIWSTIGPQIEQVMTTGEATWYEDQYLPIERNGRLEDVWWTYSYSPVRDDDGRIAATLVVCQETTSRVLSDQRQQLLTREIAVERRRLEEVFRHAPAFLSVVRGPDNVFDLVNEAYYQLVGHDRDVVGRPLFEVMPELRGQGFDEYIAGVRETGTPLVLRSVPALLRRTPGGALEERFIDVTYLPLAEADGTHDAVIAHGTDVTEQVVARRDVERLLGESEAAQAALAASEARLRDVLEQASVAVAVLTGPEHVFTIVSPRYASSTGGGRRLLGRSVREAFPELAGSPYFEVIDRVYATGEPYAAPERRVMIDNDGDGVLEERFFDIGYQPLRDATGRVYAVASVSADVTAQVRARRVSEVAREAAESANRTKAEFLATMSHELRTPLNAIAGYTELIELGIHGPVTEAQREALSRIQTSQRHLLGLINGVLNYSRVEAGAVRYDLEAVPVAEAVATCEALTAPQRRTKKLAGRFDTGSSALMVRADREKLQQIVLNLLSNAIKFTESGGQIAVTARRVDGHVAISVRDSGRGIPSDRLENVFEPFVQVDARLTRTQEGVGLGLAISRDLARGMGGDLTVESELGEGSTFTLSLPEAAGE